MTSRQLGVTLIELLVTLSIVVILMTVAVPGMQEFMSTNRLSTTTTDFMGTLNYARSEAVKRGTQVTACMSANGSSCATSGDWSQGRIVFLDVNGDGTVDSGDGDTVLRTSAATASGYTLKGTVDAITFERNGSTHDTGTVTLCVNSDEAKAQSVIITAAGARISTGSAEITSCDPS
jgi:type IV fimbrial biogenesis protein FimT